VNEDELKIVNVLVLGGAILVAFVVLLILP
jgi:hypothetical protein